MPKGVAEMKKYDTEDSLAVFENILKEKGSQAENAGVETAVSAFREFLDYEFDCEADELIWETQRCGGFCFFILVRQFRVRDGFKRLRLELSLKDNPTDTVWEDCLWNRDGNFFETVTGSKAYGELRGKNCKCDICMEEI